MRLTDVELATIKMSAREAFGPDVIVRVFGSRLDDERRGGDIDLHLQVSEPDKSASASARFRRLLDRRMGEREYDILVAGVGDPMSAVDRKAISQGLVL